MMILNSCLFAQAFVQHSEIRFYSIAPTLRRRGWYMPNVGRGLPSPPLSSPLPKRICMGFHTTTYSYCCRLWSTYWTYVKAKLLAASTGRLSQYIYSSYYKYDMLCSSSVCASAHPYTYMPVISINGSFGLHSFHGRNKPCPQRMVISDLPYVASGCRYCIPLVLLAVPAPGSVLHEYCEYSSNDTRSRALVLYSSRRAYRTYMYEYLGYECVYSRYKTTSSLCNPQDNVVAVRHMFVRNTCSPYSNLYTNQGMNAINGHT